MRSLSKIYHCLLGIIVLAAFQGMGELIVTLTSSKVPSAVIGLLLLFCILQFIKKIPAFLENTVNILLPLLPLFILPSCVAIIDFQELLVKEFFPLLISIIVGLILTLAVTPRVFQFFLSHTSNLKSTSGEDNG